MKPCSKISPIAVRPKTIDSAIKKFEFSSIFTSIFLVKLQRLNKINSWGIQNSLLELSTVKFISILAFSSNPL